MTKKATQGRLKFLFDVWLCRQVAPSALSLSKGRPVGGFLRGPLVRQVKPVQSCRMKGVYHVNCSFARVADGAATWGNPFVEAS